MSATAEPFRAEDFFRSEIAEAKRMGFNLQVSAGRVGVAVRMMPCTPKTFLACRAVNANAFESRCVVPEGGNAIDAMREAIRACIAHTKDALA